MFTEFIVIYFAKIILFRDFLYFFFLLSDVSGVIIL